MNRSSLVGDLADASILVTGAGGFIGAALCGRLKSQGVEVHGVSRAPDGRNASVTRWWRCDLGDLAQVQRLVSSLRPDRVVHLAGHVSGAPDVELVLPTLRSNLLGTVNLLLAANDVGCQRVVNAGTMMEPDDSDDARGMSSPYAVSKWAGTTYARMFHDLYGLPVVNLRIFMVYGPGQTDVRKLIPHAIISLLKRERPRMASGVWPIDWVYVDDVVDAFIAAMVAPDVEGESFDVGSGVLVSIRDVILRIAKLVGSDVEPEFGALPDRPNEFQRTAVLSPARERLGWVPMTQLEDGLKRTVEWYRDRLDSGGFA